MIFVESYSPSGLPKLFTVGGGAKSAPLTLPPMNNFGRPIRIDRICPSLNPISMQDFLTF
jgi:hypothetical protein